MNEPIRIGTCDLCGTPDVELYFEPDGYLPEEFEGVGCMNCIATHREEGEKKDVKDAFRGMDDDGFW